MPLGELGQHEGETIRGWIKPVLTYPKVERAHAMGKGFPQKISDAFMPAYWAVHPVQDTVLVTVRPSACPVHCGTASAAGPTCQCSSAAGVVHQRCTAQAYVTGYLRDHMYEF